MTKQFAPEYDLNEQGWIKFPPDSDYRKRMFPPEVNTHPAKANVYLVQAIIEYVSEPDDILMDIMAGNAAYGLEKAIDTTVNTLFQSLTDTWAGSDGQTFTDDIFISLQEGLDEGDVPRANRSLVGDPSMVADIYKIDKFMSYDYSKRPFETDAYVGTLPAYNVPVFVSNNLSNTTTGAYGALLHRDAIGVVIQSDLKVERFRVPWQHSDGVNVSAFYGCAVLRSTFGVEFFTRKK